MYSQPKHIPALSLWLSLWLSVSSLLTLLSGICLVPLTEWSQGEFTGQGSWDDTVHRSQPAGASITMEKSRGQTWGWHKAPSCLLKILLFTKLAVCYYVHQIINRWSPDTKLLSITKSHHTQLYHLFHVWCFLLSSKSSYIVPLILFSY